MRILVDTEEETWCLIIIILFSAKQAAVYINTELELSFNVVLS